MDIFEIINIIKDTLVYEDVYEYNSTNGKFMETSEVNIIEFINKITSMISFDTRKLDVCKDFVERYNEEKEERIKKSNELNKLYQKINKGDYNGY